jgi:RNA polymerase sigma-70 factor (ECF subfamily)
MALTSPVLERLAEGDCSAVDECIQRYGGLIWSIGKRYLKDVSDLEDVTQEVFVELWRTADRFDQSRSTEGSFISMIARRRCIDRLRRIRSGHECERLDEQLGTLPDKFVTGISAVDNSLSDEEDLSRVMDCLGKLDEVRRQVLIMNLRDGKVISQIADQLQLPLGTAKSHARRALIQVRRCLGLEPDNAGGGATVKQGSL